MHPIRQLQRQGGKTLAGILLIALAVAIVLVCLGQSLAAQVTYRAVQRDFTTIAMPTQLSRRYVEEQSGATFTGRQMNPEVAQWLEQIIQENPHLTRGFAHTTLASAYLPQVDADHYSIYASTLYGSGETLNGGRSGYTSPQDGAMLAVRLTGIEEPQEQYKLIYESDLVTVHCRQFLGVEMKCTAVVEQVVSLAAAQQDCTGWAITLTVRMPDWESLEQLDLAVGQRYMVSGTDYFDNLIELGRWINDQRLHRSLSIAPFHMDGFYMLTDEDKEIWLTHDPVPPVAIYGDKNVITDGIPSIPSSIAGYNVIDNNKVFLIDLKDPQIKYVNTATMTVENAAAMPVYDGASEAPREIYTVCRNGVEETLSREEYVRRYATPTIAKLEGTVEQFLADNPFWQTALEQQQVNHHAFPVYCVDNLSFVPDFNRGLARIVQGRDFTQEELEEGAKVCVISEIVAQRNGIQVGDTLSARFYGYDSGVPYQNLLGYGYDSDTLSNPAWFFDPALYCTQEEEQYTVVGIYRKDGVWEERYENAFSTTPNALFVPKSAVQAPTLSSPVGMYNVVVLENGAIARFDSLFHGKEWETVPASFISADGYTDLLVYSDQGYTTVQESMTDFMALSRQVLLVGLGLYGVLLAVYMLLFPLSMGKRLRTMATLGAPRGEKIRHMVMTSLGIFVPGAALGAVLGIGLWSSVIRRMLVATGLSLSVNANVGLLLLIPLAQLAVATALVALVAVPMTGHKNLMKHK